jgi:hypothetical protein
VQRTHGLAGSWHLLLLRARRDAIAFRIGSEGRPSRNACAQARVWHIPLATSVPATGGGNHRGSVFRRLVGNAIKNRDHLAEPRSWDVANDPATAASLLGLTREQVVIAEQPLEAAGSDYIRGMSVLWLAIDDTAGPRSDRGIIERNTIALLSNYGREATDPSSREWLGSHCDRERLRRSGLWNNHYTDQEYETTQLAVIEGYVQRMQRTDA